MVKTIVLSVVLASVLGRTASAADPDPDSAIDSAQDGVDPDTAHRLAIIGSAVPAGIIGLGVLGAATGANASTRDVAGATAGIAALALIVTPSIGAFYAHHYLDPAIALRAAGSATLLIGLEFAFSNEIGDCYDGEPNCHVKPRTYGLLIAGAGAIVGGVALDIAMAPRWARSWNNEHHLALVPTAADGAVRPTGLALTGTF